jgi:hypothetical protein
MIDVLQHYIVKATLDQQPIVPVENTNMMPGVRETSGILLN